MDIAKIQEFQRQFAKEREWEQFHTPKNLSMALSAEVGELLEIFQWLTTEQSDNLKESEKKNEVSEELADITYYVLRIADMMDIDLEKAVWDKMKKNADKYPVSKAKGNAKKYTEL
jgi:NTP pyrophosphatase (non-canonical NTP hydrolase)